MSKATDAYHGGHEDARNEFELRRRAMQAGAPASIVLNGVASYSKQIEREVLRLLAEFPHLEGESPDRLFCRYITPETAPSYESVLRRAAFALLHLRAVDRAEMADPNSGAPDAA